MLSALPAAACKSRMGTGQIRRNQLSQERESVMQRQYAANRREPQCTADELAVICW
jgi:hypothetical protein